MIVRQRYNAIRPVDQAFNQLARSLSFNPSIGPDIKATWVDNEYVLTVDLPGVPSENVNVNVVGDTLVISATDGDSSFERTLRIHSQLDANKVTARHLDGRLTITIGKVDAPEPRQIAIDTTPVPQVADAVEASSDDADQSAGEENSAG